MVRAKICGKDIEICFSTISLSRLSDAILLFLMASICCAEIGGIFLILDLILARVASLHPVTDGMCGPMKSWSFSSIKSLIQYRQETPCTVAVE